MPLNKITSPALSPNLNISLARVLEGARLNASALGGNVDIDVVNNTVYLFNANTTANITFNLRGNTTDTFNSTTSIGETTSVAIAVVNGNTRYTANVTIDGVTPQTVYYAGNVKPGFSSIANRELNLFNYTIFKTAPSNYIVISGNTLFGLG